ncbi:hypothetical protein LYNGBM3L_31900 [Moorena producens 3L]|uniref:Uncharacterized protein n=1 Tax=Moorena producens 3L TaxID=489825 RepID=F4XU52_9CYAN|nr:hypothetical protein LYNGBM3L_31900 [Moorena producens 3L]
MVNLIAEKQCLRKFQVFGEVYNLGARAREVWGVWGPGAGSVGDGGDFD